MSLTEVGAFIVTYYKKFDKDIIPGKQAIRFNIDIYADNVSEPNESYNGIKFMYRYKYNGQVRYPQQSKVKWGSSNGWVNCSMEVIVEQEIIGEDFEVSECKLSFGLQNSSGTVYFSNMSVETFDTISINYSVPGDFKCKYTKKVTSRNRVRGAMSPAEFKEEDFDEFKKWHGNIFRWQLVGYKGSQSNLTEYNEWLNSELDILELVLKKAEELKIWSSLICIHLQEAKIKSIKFSFKNRNILMHFMISGSVLRKDSKEEKWYGDMIY